ncbi:MAG: hypothetical protein CMF56_03485 [Leifsonia sp.]|nr:hypothetical protein [Leifsonia sp.]|tara:strand:+ start:2318 stop:3220 length:903 start_codon:yes stop_codon:yes gene_type:complete
MRWGRLYFAAQAVLGAAWWVAVAGLPGVREATLGGLDPLVVAVLDVPLFVVGSALAAAGIRAAAVIATAWTLLVTLALAGYATITTEAGWGVVAMAAASAGSVVALLEVILGRVPTEWIMRGPFAFRVARPRQGRAVHVAATMLQIAVFWGFFLVAIPLVVVAAERRWDLHVALPEPVGVIGVVVLALSSALGIWSGLTMSIRGNGTPLPAAMPNEFVVSGPYRFVRNPMALSGIVQGAAVGLILSSWLVVAYAVVGSLVWNYAVRPHEEADLEAKFGDEFRAYRDSVRCWIPQRPALLG